MLVLLVAADPDQPRGWVKLAYDQSRPMVDEIARAMSHWRDLPNVELSGRTK
jgi:hypothetical protein